MMTYGLQSPYVKQMLSTWATQNYLIPKDWGDLLAAVRNSKWLTWGKDEASVMGNETGLGALILSRLSY